MGNEKKTVDSSEARRWFGIDVVRLASFIAILDLHFTSRMSDSFHDPYPNHLGWYVLAQYARVLAFSGFTMVFIFSALTGVRGKSLETMKRPLSIILLGWVVFIIFEIAFDHAPLFLLWDVYPLLGLGIWTSLLFCQGNPKRGRILAAFGFLFLCIPFWKMQFLSRLPFMVAPAIVGLCDKDLADWPILPWIGLIWLGYGIGLSIRHTQQFALRRLEMSIWALLLASSLPFVGRFTHTDIGGGFSCFIYRQGPWHFFLNMLWPIFFMRVSLDPKVQGVLETIPLVRWISSLKLSKQFGPAFLLHQLLIWTVSVLWLDLLNRSAGFSFLICISILPITELLLHIPDFITPSINAGVLEGRTSKIRTADGVSPASRRLLRYSNGRKK